MKFLTGNIVLLFFIVLSSFAQDNNLPAFPGAEGFGKYVTGGRGGRVIYVTTLEDHSSAGSLRYAINQSGPRLVLFRVSGTIQLKSSLTIRNKDITIAGQTAPGDGITLRDYPVNVNADNVIIRFMRFRMGDETDQEADALGGRNYSNIIVDHCSMSWSTDECASFYGNKNFTMQWCILSESLRNSVHAKGKHGYGGIWGGELASFHHNLLAHHDSRNPRFCGSRYTNRPADEKIDFRNNVIYNWGGNSAYGGEGGSYNMVSNYYKAGPATSSSSKARIMQADADNGGNSQPAGIFGKYFVDGNYMTASSLVTQDNSLGLNLGSTFNAYAPGVTKSEVLVNEMFPTGEVTTHTAQQAYEKVLQFVGASLAQDSIDMRIIHETSTGTVTYADGGNGSTNGLIDTQGAVGGWPVLNSGDAPADTDQDGMPDEWETSNGLNPDSDADAQLKSVDGIYPNLEVYLNSLVSSIIDQQNEDGIATAVSDVKTSKNKLNAYYNGSSQEFVVRHHSTMQSLAVYNISGKLLLNTEVNSSIVELPFAGLKKGIYLVRAIDVQNQIYTVKVPVF